LYGGESGDMTARDALQEGAAALAGTETPFLDASLLLADALGITTTFLHASGPDPVDEAGLARYRLALASRGRGMPVAYILGYKEFWGRRFMVDGRVLIPRADTETLVEATLKLGDVIVRERKETIKASTAVRRDTETTESGLRDLRDLRVPSSLPHLRVHEACTGSGCVAISLAAEKPEWELSASDLSERALEVAEANAETILGPDLNASTRPGGKLSFSRSDLLSSVSGPLEMIVANPPYVPSAETDSLLGLGWSEPRMALDGGKDGLDLVRRLVPEAASRLSSGGALLVEADGEEAALVAELFHASRFIDIQTLCDLGGRPRVTSGRRPWTT
jgi:release factor glutamine methyltransferase